MAIGLIKLSKKQRSTLSTVFVTLNTLQVMSGAIMISCSMYIYVNVAPVLYSERAEVSYVFLVVFICGLNNIFHYLFGIKIAQKCMKQSYKKSTRSLVFAWCCMSFYIIFYLILLASMTRKVYKHIARSMKHSLNLGMLNYLKDSVWKVTIDRIQFDLQCCGILNYKEWHEIAWLDKSQVNAKSETVKQYRSGDSWSLPVTPWSCCRLTFPMQCLHDPLQQLKASNVWVDQPTLVEESLNTEGCLDKLKTPIQGAMTCFIVLVVLNCLIQVVIFIICRILYTSCRNAIFLEDPEGIAPGWIFGRGDFGYSRGKTLQEIMYDSPAPTTKNDTSPGTSPKTSPKTSLQSDGVSKTGTTSY